MGRDRSVCVTFLAAPHFQEKGDRMSGSHLDGLRTGLSGDFQAQVTERTIRREIHSRRPPAQPPPPLPGPGRIKTADWMQQFGSFLLLK